MPLLSSTPAVTASALAEETGGKFVLRSQLTEQEEATLHYGNRGVLDRNDQEVAHVTEERGPRHGASERGPSVSFVDASSPVVVATAEETESAPEIPESTDSTAASGGFSLDGTTVFEPEVTSNEYQSNAAVTLSAPPKPSLQVTASGAFVAVGKSAESQTALNATDTEPSKPSRGSFHPAVTEKVKTDLLPASFVKLKLFFLVFHLAFKWFYPFFIRELKQTRRLRKRERHLKM